MAALLGSSPAASSTHRGARPPRRTPGAAVKALQASCFKPKSVPTLLYKQKQAPHCYKAGGWMKSINERRAQTRYPALPTRPLLPAVACGATCTSPPSPMASCCGRRRRAALPLTERLQQHAAAPRRVLLPVPRGETKLNQEARAGCPPLRTTDPGACRGHSWRFKGCCCQLPRQEAF